MKHTAQCLLRLTCIGSLIFSISSCGGGGEEGAPPPISTVPQTIVSGTVQAPGGQIALFKKNSFRDLFVSEAYAALTGLTSVPDNTIVQLARLDANASSISVISTTSTSGGLYSFNLTTLGLQPANDLIVRVAGSGRKEMRAFVVGTVADINPASEAAYQLAVQSLNGGFLNNLTLQEVSDISGAVALTAMLQNLGAATAIDQAVGLIKTSAGTNAQLVAFLAAAAGPGQTAQGTGDVGNFYPFDQGSLWRYNGTTGGSLGFHGYDTTVHVSGQGPAPGDGAISTVFSETTPQGENKPRKGYGIKTTSGITWYGNDDSDDNLTNQLAPYQAIHFPLTIGNTIVLAERTGLNWGNDEDGDGQNESVDMALHQTAQQIESLTIPGGSISTPISFPLTIRVETKATFLVRFTKGGSATVLQRNTSWQAPGIGKVKEIIEAGFEDDPLIATFTEEIVGYVVNGQGNGLRIELMPGTTSTTLPQGNTHQLQAVAYDQQNRPLIGFPLSWSSSDSSIVNVDQNGLVTGITPGTSMVKASIGTLVSNSFPVVVMDLRMVSMYTRDIAYDRVTNRIYASVADHSGSLSNTLASVNPQTGTVEWSIAVGTEPGKLALSDDGQYVYIGVNGGKSVARFHIPSRTVQQTFGLGTYGLLDMLVLVGSPQSLAIARFELSSGAPGGVAIYDNGAPRGLTTPGWGQTFDAIPTILEHGTSNGTIFAYGKGSVFLLSITSSGASIGSMHEVNFDGGDMVQEGGLLYFPSGEVYNPITSTLVKTYSVPPINNDLNKVLPYSTLNRVFFAQYFSAYEWLSFDQTSLAPTGSVNIYNIGTGAPLRFIRWGSNGLALSTDAGQLFLLRSTLFQ
jgi:Bacterial Ig-like domain (group 2)